MQRTKEEILRELNQRKEEFTNEEVLFAIKKETTRKTLSKQKTISAVAYSLGALIVMIGVFLLMKEFWNDIGSFFRIGVTFGLGVLVFSFLLFLETTSRGQRILKEPLSIISGILVFIGGLIFANEVFPLEINPVVFIVVSLMTMVMFSSLYFLRKSSVYLFFIITSFSGTLYSLLSLDGVQRSLYQSMKEPLAAYLYLTSLLGFSYLSLAYFLNRKRLSSLLYIIGGIAMVSPLFALAQIYSASSWNILALLLIIGLGVVGYYLKLGLLAIVGGVLLIASIFSIKLYGFFTFPGFLLLVLIIFLSIKKNTSLPYFIVIIGASTLLPYAILSLSFIQKSIIFMNNPEMVYYMLTSLIGMGYILLGYYFNNNYEKFSKLLYFFGSFGLVVPLYFLGDVSSGVWDLVAILSIALITVLGVYLQERVIIFSAGILLAIHVIIVSYRYFADSIGWPVTLIFAGFLLMGVGYFSYFLSKRLEN